jgi:predicted CopG family antitoxin
MEDSMVQRINISISDELFEKIQNIKQGFTKDFSISKICSKALEQSLEDALTRDVIWKTGFNDGKEYVQTLSSDEVIKAKKMILNLPRKLPDDLLELLMKVNLIGPDNLQKHLSIISYWKSIHSRFDPEVNTEDQLPGKKEGIDIWEWGGSPAVHEGVEIWVESADIRWNKIEELWRKGLIDGITDATLLIEVPND